MMKRWSGRASFAGLITVSSLALFLAGCGGSSADNNNPRNSNALLLMPPGALPACPAAPNTLRDIDVIQGADATSAYVGQLTTVRGVVVGDFQASNRLRGFFIQQPVPDNDPKTSEGIFVYAPGNATIVKLGDYVQVSGTVEERKATSTDTESTTQISQLSQVTVCGKGPTIQPATISLPVANPSDLRAYEGMLVKFTQSLTVTDVHSLGQYGEVVLAPSRLFTPYSNPAGNDALANAALNARSTIILDDGSSPANPNPTPYLSASDKSGTRRVGDTVQNVQGIMTYGFGSYLVQPTQQATFTATNPRPAAPNAVGGTLRAGSLNVLNYFTTLNKRGANTVLELQRQRDKLVMTITGLNADVLGLMEIENNASTTIGDLVAAVNAKLGANTYTFINSGQPGTDEIKVAIIYKPSAVTPIGNAKIPTDPGFGVDGGLRPPVAQRFAANGNNGSFWFVVNHLKSKGSCPSSKSSSDQDFGQGCWNASRVVQTAALKNWVAGLVSSSGEPDVLMVGDYNAYLNEDPIASIEAGNFEALARRLPAAERYTYVFDGQSGVLDHAFASSSMKAQVSGITVWHVNADEPAVLDYNTENKVDDRYDATPYRSSDHDPVLVGLTLNPDPAVAAPTLNAVLPTAGQAGAATTITGIAAAVINGTGTPTLTVDWGDGAGPQALAINASTASKTYAGAGTYAIKLVLTDGTGVTAELSGPVTISPAAGPGPGDGAELFFSEYVEGSSNNKALEIYNPTAAAVDLGIYKVKLYANGAVNPTTTLSLTGAIAPGATLVLYNASTAAARVAEIQGVKQTSGVANFNGDDAITLEKNGSVVDAIGQVGRQQVWTSGPASTIDTTLRRKAGINHGSIPSAYPAVWDVAQEWDAYPVDTFTGLGQR
ncbi:ExeM/NucH family extracellular endonuclease [Undibacterium sp.]|uniref:ExeM/NucH family extracellular endonuclease n=1 Tax=Undibacterium sp. TaxID=1914977 RepID=UPI002C97A776|nr:ExeM/NucH family extracellular endonuclease [Undibacterium sp.]HTD03142.1 ExeM/NucH family extracellular endonuclease [Undibacterium sp.]